MSNEEQSVNIGDQFRDNDPRLPGPRVVQVLTLLTRPSGKLVANCRVIEHWNEKQQGRITTVSVTRLATKRSHKNGYTKISR